MPWPKGKPRSLEHQQKLIKAMKGRPLSQEHVERSRQGQLCYWQSPAGMKRREEHRRRALGNTWTLGYQHTPETRAKLRQAANNRSPEWLEGHRQAMLKRRFPIKMTSLEVALRDQFKKRRLRFKMHKAMFRRFQPYFVFEDVKLIVEADGDYWHRQLGKDHTPLFQVATENGWTVWRFAESEIKMHPEACGRAVARFVQSH